MQSRFFYYLNYSLLIILHDNFLKSKQMYVYKHKLLGVDLGARNVAQQWNACLVYARLQQYRN